MCCLKRRRRIYYRDKEWKVPRDLTIPIPSQYPSQIIFPAASYNPIPSCQTTTQPYMPFTPFQPKYQANYPPIMAASSQSLPMLPAPGALVPSSALAQHLASGPPPALTQPAAMWQQPYGMAQPSGMLQPPGMMQPSTMMPPYTMTQPSPMVQPFPMAPMLQAPSYYGPYSPYNAFMHPRF
ncbi:hypothetical protein F5Y08DRAFT_233589 [Xylaria arbuscula]|nr:hypothetical protein F5Y08DRAFT_233589 [Xylaria arbuscula]